MINTDMRLYDFFTIGTKNEYGESLPSTIPVGKVKMAINITSQSIQNNVNYQNCQYIGLTYDAKVDDTYIIDYQGEKLKVLYVNPKGRMKQVFLASYD